MKGASMKTPQEYASPEWLIDNAKPGDRVTIVNRFGQESTGRVVFARPGGSPHLTLNMGGRYGTPGIATAANIVKVKFAKEAA
jgi:hypothetical protein